MLSFIWTATRKHAAAREVFQKIPVDSVHVIHKEWQLRVSSADYSQCTVVSFAGKLQEIGALALSWGISVKCVNDYETHFAMFCNIYDVVHVIIILLFIIRRRSA